MFFFLILCVYDWISACADLECDFYGHKGCEPHYQFINATCECKPGFYELADGTCQTDEVIIDVSIVIGQTFQEEYTSLKANETIDLKTRLETQITLQLDLTPPEYFKVIRFTAGSVIVDGLVILPQNTTENTTTVEQKLVNEIQTNQTGHLAEFNATKVTKVEGNLKVVKLFLEEVFFTSDLFCLFRQKMPDESDENLCPTFYLEHYQRKSIIWLWFLLQRNL